MSLLENVVNIWEDLDPSYKELKDELNVKTPLEFCKVLINYNDIKKTSSVFYILSRLQIEMSEYSGSDLSTYTTVADLLNGVETLLVTGMLNEDSTFKEILGKVLDLKNSSSVSDIVRKLPDDFIESLMPAKLPTGIPHDKIKSMSFKDIYTATGGFGTTYMPDGTVYMLDTSQQNIFVYGNENDIINYLNYVEQNNSSLSDFDNRLVTALKLLSSKNYLKANTLFIDSSLYLDKDNSAEDSLGLPGKFAKSKIVGASFKSHKVACLGITSMVYAI